jgi:hypothetical protein
MSFELENAAADSAWNAAVRGVRCLGTTDRLSSLGETAGLALEGAKNKQAEATTTPKTQPRCFCAQGFLF